MTKILIGVTGSVATIKLLDLVRDLQAAIVNLEIKIIATERSLQFLDSSLQYPIYRDEDEWKSYKIGDPVLHIELRKWADILLVAPLSANSLGKIANGLCDNLLTCVVRAWDPTKKLVICPAMNTAMYENPITKLHLNLLHSYSYIVIIDPIVKKLACGDVGIGAMAGTLDIAAKIKSIL